MPIEHSEQKSRKQERREQVFLLGLCPVLHPKMIMWDNFGMGWQFSSGNERSHTFPPSNKLCVKDWTKVKCVFLNVKQSKFHETIK